MNLKLNEDESSIFNKIHNGKSDGSWNVSYNYDDLKEYQEVIVDKFIKLGVVEIDDMGFLTTCVADSLFDQIEE